jgi:hypothetical protein
MQQPSKISSALPLCSTQQAIIETALRSAPGYHIGVIAIAR